MRSTRIAYILLAALSMTVAEFVEFQKLSPDELRTRFRLSAGCDPTVTAATEPTGNKVMVAVECRGGAATPGSASPRENRAAPAGRGS